MVYSVALCRDFRNTLYSGAHMQTLHSSIYFPSTCTVKKEAVRVSEMGELQTDRVHMHTCTHAQATCVCVSACL
jgi:hypothetical protein